jgi:FlaA1/EpsC-like NDP-sugar epimerase
MIKRFLSLSRGAKQAISVAVDMALLALAFWSALALRFETFTPEIAAYKWQLIAAPMLAIPVFVRLGLYRAVVRFMEDRVVFVVVGGVTISVLLLAAFAIFIRAPSFRPVRSSVRGRRSWQGLLLVPRQCSGKASL